MKTLRNIALVIITIGIFLGVRYIGSLIHYGCHPDRIVNTYDGDDCAPPFEGIGELSFYLTGGSLNPLLNRDALTVRKVSWQIDEQKMAADITTYDGKTKRYELGIAFGCTTTVTSELQNHTIVIGRVKCGDTETSTTFTAFKSNGGFYIERNDESYEDSEIITTTLVEIK